MCKKCKIEDNDDNQDDDSRVLICSSHWSRTHCLAHAGVKLYLGFGYPGAGMTGEPPSNVFNQLNYE